MCMIEVGPAHCASRHGPCPCGADLALVADLPAGLRVEGRPTEEDEHVVAFLRDLERPRSESRSMAIGPSASGWR